MSSARKSSPGFTVAGALGLVFGVLLGCPLYDDDCSDEAGCARGFVCDRLSTRCVAVVIPPACTRPADCAAAETCTPDFECRPGSCDFHGCVTGFACGVLDGAHACVAPVVDAGTDAGFSLTDAAAPALPTDAGDAAVAPPVVVDAGGEATLDASF